MTIKLEGHIKLNPEDEFEAVLIDIVNMHREKSKAYGTDKDALWNFYDGAARLGLHPLIVCEAYRTKHESALANWRQELRNNGTAAHTRYSDDGHLDRAVYDILSLVIYRRETT